MEIEPKPAGIGSPDCADSSRRWLLGKHAIVAIQVPRIADRRACHTDSEAVLGTLVLTNLGSLDATEVCVSQFDQS